MNAADFCMFGDCRDSMRQLIAESVKVQMCVTSPPYFGLRDYGTAAWEGGDAECDHSKGTAASKTSTLKNDGRPNPGSNNYERSVIVPYLNMCGKCGAIRVDKQLGLESTPQEYVSNMVEVFRLVRDLLDDAGVLWLNLGDSYASGGMSNPSNKSTLGGGKDRGAAKYSISRAIPDGLKPKDLIGIPWRVAFALQDDGWYLRQDIIWNKPNPMPESVTDRCTKAHEYMFLLSKKPNYYFDHEAIKEPAITAGMPVKMADGWDTGPGAHGSFHREGREKGKQNNSIQSVTRNKRSVWEVATQPYSEAHFATFPPALIEPCILAGSRPGDIVLDPFLGSGTTAQVAQNLGRRWIGCELNNSNLYLQKARTRQQGFALEVV